MAVFLDMQSRTQLGQPLGRDVREGRRMRKTFAEFESAAGNRPVELSQVCAEQSGGVRERRETLGLGPEAAVQPADMLEMVVDHGCLLSHRCCMVRCTGEHALVLVEEPELAVAEEDALAGETLLSGEGLCLPQLRCRGCLSCLSDEGRELSALAAVEMAVSLERRTRILRIGRDVGVQRLALCCLLLKPEAEVAEVAELAAVEMAVSLERRPRILRIGRDVGVQRLALCCLLLKPEAEVAEVAELAAEQLLDRKRVV